MRFLAHGPGYGLYLTPAEAVLVLEQPGGNTNGDPGTAVALRVSAVGAQATAALSGVDELPGKASYFIGNDPSQWRTNVPTYARVRYSGVYPGIDLVYYGQQRQLEYDFVVAPGADADDILLGFDGADELEINAEGDLILHTMAGDVRQHRPVVYQEVDGSRREIDGGYVRKGATRVGFKVAAYDHTRPLVIDPVLVYSTYLGGSDYDSPSAIAIDADGNVYVTGITQSTDFPTTAGALRSSTIDTNGVVFVSKLNSTGSALVFSATFGGAFHQILDSRGIAVDSDHNVYVVGETSSRTFPTTEGAFQRINHGGSHCCDAFVTKLNAAGSGLLYSTYLGGTDDEVYGAIAVDVDGNAYITGTTRSFDFPTTPGAFQTTLGSGSGFDAFVTKLNPSGSALVYSTYLGGTDGDGGDGIAVDVAGNAFVTGATSSTNFPITAGAFQTVLRGPHDAFVTKLNSTGSALDYSTYLGGTGGYYGTNSTSILDGGIAIDTSGHAYVTGSTDSTDFPVTSGAFQTKLKPQPPDVFQLNAFVTKLDPSGSTLVYSTYLGGSDSTGGFGIAVDADGNAFVTGFTSSTDFPRTFDACGPASAGNQDAFVTVLDPSGSALVYSTTLGGSGYESGLGIAVDAGGNAYVTGTTNPSCDSCTNDYPTTLHAFQPLAGRSGDGFVVKIAEPELPPMPAPTTSTPDVGRPENALPAAAPVYSTSSDGSRGGGGGAIDWLTLPVLLAAVAFMRRRRDTR